MKDEQKTKEQLIDELVEMRHRIAELEASETERKQVGGTTQRLLDQQVAVNRLALALGEYRNLDKVYHTIYEHVHTLMDIEAFIVSFYDKEEQLIRAGHVMTGGTVHDTTHYPPIPLEEVGYGTQSQVIHTGQPLYAPDWRKAMARTKTEYKIAENGTVSKGPPPREEQDTSTNSALFVPMKIGGETIGVMQVQSHRLDAYSQEDIDLLSALANVAAIAIQNTRLYEETRSRAERLAAVNRIARAVGAPLHLNDLLETVYQEITSVFQADAFFIALYNKETKELDFRIQVDQGTQESPRWQPLGEGLTSLVITEKKPLLIRNYEQEQDHLPSPRVWGTMKSPASWLGVPMQIGERVIGVICVQAYHSHAYGEEEQLLLSTIADQVAVAVENARLLEAEREQRELAEALEKAAAVVSSTLEPEEVLDHILEQVQQVVAGDTFNIILIENGNGRVVRGRGYDQLGVAYPPAGGPLPIAEFPNLAKIAQSGEPLVIMDTATDPDWIPLEGRDWLRSYVAAPIRVRDLTVGFLNVNGTRPGQFGPADARRLEAFAAHAATAIENAHLYRELLNHAEQLEQRVQDRTAQLQTQYARLEAILRSTTDGIIVTGGGGEILQTNPIAQTWLAQTLSPEDAARLRGAVQDLARQAEERPETILELTGLDLELKAAPVMKEETEEPTAAVVAAHDVSHLKALDRMKSRFVSNVSHELRTPVTTIKLYAALMQRSPPEKWGKYLDALAQEADRQAWLVENILQISRIDTGRLEMEPRPTSLNQLTEETIASHQVLAQERGLNLEHHLMEPEPVALVDPERLMQVLNNLVENAIHYTPEGGKVVISTGKEKTEGRMWATVTVADTGMGIPEEELPHIFERFFRGEEPRLTQISGTGLGLAIVKELVELHGGQVTVASEVDVGSTFTVRLPLAEGHG